ncbi:MAG: threonylcarbamoyl-AMP synthase [Bacteroidales bacterium]|jgi:L-threonylcarbamoyladenylate synthase|nr:threonylcarbamoyl-AMP synthase [Bacteroidales bacterium]
MNWQTDIQQAVGALKKGGVILYPTDTVWGLGCDATNAQAIDRIYSIKKRAAKHSMLVLAADMRMLQTYVPQIPDVALQLLEYADKPLSIVYPDAILLPENLVADDASIGIRLPNDPFCSDLIHAFGKPIVSTSANISGEPAPAHFAQISDAVKQSVDYTVRWRQNDRQPATASSIIKVEKDNSFRIIRL